MGTVKGPYSSEDWEMMRRLKLSLKFMNMNASNYPTLIEKERNFLKDLLRKTAANDDGQGSLAA